MSEQQKIEGVPDGWELVRIGKPRGGLEERFIDDDGMITRYVGDIDSTRVVPIIRKLPTWRPAKPSDLDGGVPVNARYQTCLHGEYCYGDLVGVKWIEGTMRYIIFGKDGYHPFCEVLES